MGTDIGGEVNRLIDSFVGWLPKIVGALAIFVIGWGVAAILRSLATRFLVSVGLNRRVFDSPADSFVRRITHDPARAIGNFIYWLVMIITITVVIGALEIPVLTQIVAGVYSYIPNILAAILILALGIAASAMVGGAMVRWMGDTPTGKILGSVLPVLIMSITGFAILEQLKIAPAVVLATYIAIIGAVALGFALAFGLGGAEAAGRIMDNAYEAGYRNIGQAKKDIERGRDRAKEDAEKARRKADK